MPSVLAKHRGLVAFDAGAQLQLEPGDELPKRILVAPWGKHETPKGAIAIGDRTAAQLPGNQRSSQFDRVALDFNHNTVPGSESYRGEPAKVAAHGTPTVVPGEGVYLDDLEWTPEGKEFVGGRHYIDLSPTLQLNGDGEAVFLHSAAVCRQGAIPGLTLFSASALPPQLAALSAAAKATSSKTQSSMDPKELLAALLGVDPSADDDTFKAAATTFASNLKPLSALAEQLKAFSADDIKTLKTFSSGEHQTFKSLAELPQQLKDVIAEVAGLKGAHVTAERNEIVRSATLEGKAIPEAVLTGEGALNNVQLKALCASLPVTVPLDRRTVVSLSASSAGVSQNAAEIEVFSALGLTDEQVKKFGK